jgi:hypothetical protein
MKTYHFNLDGEPNRVGLAGEIRANDDAQALSLLSDYLTTLSDGHTLVGHANHVPATPGFGYVNVYANLATISPTAPAVTMAAFDSILDENGVELLVDEDEGEDEDDEESCDYTVSLELNVTAESAEEAIRFFLDDANDASLEFHYTVQHDGVTEDVLYSHDDDEDDNVADQEDET